MYQLASYGKSFPFRTSAVRRSPISSFHFRFSSVSLLFSAFPYKISITPLFSALTHFDRGGRVLTLDIQTVSTYRPLCSNQLRSCPSRNSFLFTTICVAGCGVLIFTSSGSARRLNHKSRVFRKLPPLALFFAAITRPLSFVFTNLQTLFCRPGGGPESRRAPVPPQQCGGHSFTPSFEGLLGRSAFRSTKARASSTARSMRRARASGVR
jgi:hypothetical protein